MKLEETDPMFKGVAAQAQLVRFRALAEEASCILKPYCERVEIVGSVRRGKEIPRDIELLVIPKFNEGKDWLGQPTKVNALAEQMEKFIAQGTFERGEPAKNGAEAPLSERYSRLKFKGVGFDLFVCLPATCIKCGSIVGADDDILQRQMPELRKGILLPEPKILLEGVQHGGHEEEKPSGMRRMRPEIYPQTGGEGSSLRRGMPSKANSQTESREERASEMASFPKPVSTVEDHKEAKLRGSSQGVSTRAPIRKSEGVDNGTSIGDGKEIRPVSYIGGNGSSSERGENGQQDRESRDSDPREEPRRSNMSSLWGAFQSPLGAQESGGLLENGKGMQKLWQAHTKSDIQLLQQGMPTQGPEKEMDEESRVSNGVQDLRKDLRSSSLDKRVNLQQQMQDGMARTETQKTSNEMDDFSKPVSELESPKAGRRGIPSGVSPTTPARNEERVREGTQVNHGNSIGEVSTSGRGSPSQERREDGQPNRKLGDSDARQESWSSDMSSMRPNISHPLKCPQCGSTKIRQGSQWGVLSVFRSGPSEFSKAFAKRLWDFRLRSVDGHIEDTRGNTIPTPEEEDVFRLMQIAYIKPEDRTPDKLMPQKLQAAPKPTKENGMWTRYERTLPDGEVLLYRNPEMKMCSWPGCSFPDVDFEVITAHYISVHGPIQEDEPREQGKITGGIVTPDDKAMLVLEALPKERFVCPFCLTAQSSTTTRIFSDGGKLLPSLVRCVECKQTCEKDEMKLTRNPAAFGKWVGENSKHGFWHKVPDDWRARLKRIYVGDAMTQFWQVGYAAGNPDWAERQKLKQAGVETKTTPKREETPKDELDRFRGPDGKVDWAALEKEAHERRQEKIV